MVGTRDDLRELALRYAQAVDRRDAPLLTSLFTADGAILDMDSDLPAFQGAEALARMIAMVEASFVKTMHNVFNQTYEIDGGIDGDGAHATGEVYCTASHILADPSGNWRVLDMAIRYLDAYARGEGGWKFARRRILIEWVETRPVQQFSLDMLSKNPGRII